MGNETAPEIAATPKSKVHWWKNLLRKKERPVDTQSRLDTNETELVGGFYIIPFWKIWVLTFVVAICLTLTGVWQLLLVAGFLGGFFPKGYKLKHGLRVGFLGGLAAWLFLFGFYALTTEMPVFLDRLVVDIIGLDRLAIPILFLFCSTFGGIFCGLGGMNGVLVSRLAQIYKKSRASTKR